MWLSQLHTGRSHHYGYRHFVSLSQSCLFIPGVSYVPDHLFPIMNGKDGLLKRPDWLTVSLLPQDIGCKSTGISEGRMCRIMFNG